MFDDDDDKSAHAYVMPVHATESGTTSRSIDRRRTRLLLSSSQDLPVVAVIVIMEMPLYHFRSQ